MIWLVWLAALPFAARCEQIAVIHAKIWTGDTARPWARALLIDGNRIAAVGGDEQIQQRMAPHTKVIDAQGRLVIPGFNDAHTHFLSGSLGLANVDLTGICTLQAMKQAIASYARAHPEKAWITGRGWEYYCFPDQRLPTRQDLDAVVSDRPVFLAAYDGHTGWANSMALERADIHAATKFPGYGEIVKDPKTGEPSGALKEGAMALVRDRIPKVTREDKLAALRAGLKLAASLGITSIQNASGDEEELSLYEEMARGKELTLRSSLAFSLPPGTPLSRVKEVARLKSRGVRAVKLMMDGVIESNTAAMLDPYSDHPDKRGDPAWTAAPFHAIAALCDRNGLQIYTHAIGDRGVRMTLDAYEYARKQNGVRDARHRIEHIETIAPSDLTRFAPLGVMASMQPIHCDPDTIDLWSKAVGPARLPLAFPWRSIEKAGGQLVFSSDWPASLSVNPIRGLHNAVNRRTIEGKPAGGWIPEQRVSLETALRGYTTMAAYASFDEQSKGAIQPGMLADVVALSQDLFTIPPVEIHKTQVIWTIFDGRVIFTK